MFAKSVSCNISGNKGLIMIIIDQRVLVYDSYLKHNLRGSISILFVCN